MDQLVDTYAQILTDVGATDEHFERVREIMTKRGHMRLWKRVLREADRRSARMYARAQPVLTIARTDDRDASTPARVSALRTLDIQGSPRLVVDPSIVGGFILQKGFSRLDRSYKTALIKLYHRVTAH